MQPKQFVEEGYGMTTDLLELYGRASEWTLGKVAGAAAQLDVATPCDDWAVVSLPSRVRPRSGPIMFVTSRLSSRAVGSDN